MNATLTHLFTNHGKIVTSKGEIMELASINMRNVKTQVESLLTISDIENCEIYFSPEELEIQRLTKIIADQHGHIQRLMEESRQKTTGKGGKSGYKHISREEVREAEQAFVKGVSPALVASTYSISIATAKRIQDGTHPKSSIVRKES